jgi:hypothetical protein
MLPPEVETPRASAQTAPPAPTGKGVSFGFEQGGWGANWGAGLRASVPFNDYVLVALRGVYVVDQVSTGGASQGPIGEINGRLEVIGRSRLLVDTLRLYGGGGVGLTYAVGGSGYPDSPLVGGGAELGVEFFVFRRLSLFFELGGRGPSWTNNVPGPFRGFSETTIAGVSFFPFSS